MGDSLSPNRVAKEAIHQMLNDRPRHVPDWRMRLVLDYYRTSPNGYSVPFPNVYLPVPNKWSSGHAELGIKLYRSYDGRNKAKF